MPSAVKAAVTILWLSWGWVVWLSVPSEIYPDTVVWVVAAILLQAALILFASLRRNWARVLLVAHVVLGIAATLAFLEESVPWWHWFQSPFVIDGLAVGLLFLPAASTWYRTRSPA